MFRKKESRTQHSDKVARAGRYRHLGSRDGRLNSSVSGSHEATLSSPVRQDSHQRRLERLTGSYTAQYLISDQLAERRVSPDRGQQPLADRPDGETEIYIDLESPHESRLTWVALGTYPIIACFAHNHSRSKRHDRLYEDQGQEQHARSNGAGSPYHLKVLGQLGSRSAFDLVPLPGGRLT